MMLVQMLKTLLRRMFSSHAAPNKYRPERHYMRGAGPKSKARTKHVDQANNAKA